MVIAVIMNDEFRHVGLMLSDDTEKYLKVAPDQGLSPAQVDEQRAVFGANRLGKAETKSWIAILRVQFKSPLMMLLGAAAGLSMMFGDYAEGIAIVVVMVINGAIGFWAENKAEHSMAALRKMGRATTRVRRSGHVMTVPAEDLVPGDIVLFEAGDIVTADTRLMKTVQLQCDESLLTGESVPVDKEYASEDTSQSGSSQDQSQKGRMFKGTTVTRGSSVGQIVATGTNTRLGEISRLADTATGAVSPLERRLQKLSEQLLFAVLVLAVLMTIAGIVSGHEMVLMIKTGIALAVAAIPEGLPIVATLALARGMWRLAGHNALIKRLSAIETLGSVNVIFTDKTGTLTENRMTAMTLSVAENPEANGLSVPMAAARRGLRVCALCYSGTDPDHLSDPMETALVTAAGQASIMPLETEKQFPRVNEEAFDANVRMMATVHSDQKRFLYLVKGAPEAVLAASARIAGADGDEDLTDRERVFWMARTTELASGGMRILALAEKTSNDAGDAPYEGLVFLGLVSLKDPPRSDVAAAVKAAQEAGVRVVMVTGDNGATAANIAAAVGIAGAATDMTVEGAGLARLENLTREQRALMLSAAVFARMSPRQKLDLIDLHQQNDAVVAMTGDGVNDAPALKKADVGIAMGMRGTEVAKEAAAMVLKDDAFASIVIAIQQGRVIFGNIRKFVIYLMSCNLSEVLIVTFCMLAGLPLPLNPLQILFLNLITDVFPALALGFGKSDTEILHRPPRPKSEGLLQPRHWQAIVSYAVLMTISVSGAFIWALAQADKTPQYAGSIAFLTLMFSQLWHVFNMRSRRARLFDNQVARNPFVWGAILLCLILVGFAVYWPLLADILHIVPIDGKGWIVLLAASFIPLIIGQLAKYVILPRRISIRRKP